MILRVWTVGLALAKAAELEVFANEFSLPMFRAQPGCLAVLFTRTETECATVTVWDSERSVEVMEASFIYQQVVSQIEESGILGEDHQTRVFSVYGGFVSADLPRLLSAGG